VIWFRFLQLFLFGTAMTFAFMLAVILFGIAAGGLAAARGCGAIRPGIAGCPPSRARPRWPRSPATPPSRPGIAAPPSSSTSRTPRWRCRCA
jgi:hypothetical protein